MLKKPITNEYYLKLDEYGISEIDLSNIYLITYDYGEYICHEGDPFEYLMIIIEGNAKVSITSSSGKTLLISFYSGKGIIGEVEFMLNENFTCNVQATSKVVCIGIPIIHYSNYLHNNNSFLNFIGKSLARKLYRETSNSSINILAPIKTRLCAYISLTNNKGLFQENLVEVADLLGTSYRHLFRVLRQLCDEKILIKDNRKYKILNNETLLLYANDYYQKFE